MSRTIRNASKGNTSSRKGKGKDVTGTIRNANNGKDTRVSRPSFGRVLKGKGEDKDVRTQILSLLSDLQSAKDAKDRDAQKGIRRRLRSLGYWGGTRTRTNWIGRVPQDKRPSVVSLA